MCLSISLQASTRVDITHLCTGDPTTDVDKAKFNRAEAFEQRRPKQYNNEPFATTTIGSFPQTPGLPSHPAQQTDPEALGCFGIGLPAHAFQCMARQGQLHPPLLSVFGVHCYVLCCHFFTSSLTSPSYER